MSTKLRVNSLLRNTLPERQAGFLKSLKGAWQKYPPARARPLTARALLALLAGETATADTMEATIDVPGIGTVGLSSHEK